MLAACLNGTDVIEIYSPERINRVCREYGLGAGGSLDLRTGWDFEVEAHRQAALERIRREEPVYVIGSPPFHKVPHTSGHEPGCEGTRPWSSGKVPLGIWKG